MPIRNYIWPTLFAFFLPACQQLSPFPLWERLFEEQMAYLLKAEPVSLPPDSLQYLLQLGSDLLEKVDPYPNREGWPEEKIRELKNQLLSATDRLESLQRHPDRYNLAGWAKQKIAQPQKKLADRLEEVSELLEWAPAYYQNGMDCLGPGVDFERWDLAYRKNQLGILFLRNELPDSLAHCKEVDLKEKKRIQKQMIQAESAIKQYLAFLKSRETAQADSLMYSR